VNDLPDWLCTIARLCGSCLAKVRKMEELGSVDAIRGRGRYALARGIRKERLDLDSRRSERMQEPALWKVRILLATC